MDENKAREVQIAVCETGKKMLEGGLVAGTWGNISARIDEDYMVVTPSGMNYDTLNADDMVIMNMHDYSTTSKRTPSIEYFMHAKLLLNYPWANAVMHTHSTNALIMASARKPIPPVCDDQVQIIGGEVPVAEYSLPGTDDMADKIVAAIKGRFGCLIPNHGSVSLGRSLNEALIGSEIIEKAATVYLGTLLVGGPVLLKQDDIDMMHDFFLHKYGQHKK